MKVFIVYCHPSEDSFTRCIRDAFINGLKDAGHEYIVSDLYRMDFKTDMAEKEYLRDAYYDIFALVAPKLDDMLGCKGVLMKAPLYAVERIKAIQRAGFTKSEHMLIGKSGYAYDGYWTYA